MNEIFQKLISIFQYVLDNDDLVIKMDDILNDIENWDSLAHIRLIISLESSFSIRFNAKEISEIENISQLYNIIIFKISK